VYALVDRDINEGWNSWLMHNGAALNRVLVEIAVLVAEDLAIGQQHVLELEVVDRSLTDTSTDRISG